MIIDYIKEILANYKNSISIEQLEEILSQKGIKTNLCELINHSEYFYIVDGIIFLKKALNESKKVFFQEFNEYLSSKITDHNLVKTLIDNYNYFIPDVLFTEWLDINLERKLIVFDLLFNLVVRPKRIKDKFVVYFNKLVDFYTAISIYSCLIIENFSSNYIKTMEIIGNIEEFETLIKNHFYNCLVAPDIVKTSLETWINEFNDCEEKATFYLEKSFLLVNKYSPRLLKRVIEKEIKNFSSIYLLTRYDYPLLYDWLLILSENNKPETKKNLFDDLGLN